MKRNFFEEDRELFDGNDATATERIIDNLTPRFAPEARFDFRQAKIRRRIFSPQRAMQLLAAAAVLAIGLFLGLNGGGKAHAAQNMAIVEQAFADLNTSENIRISFTALVREHRRPNNPEIYKIAPGGERISAMVSISLKEGGGTVRIEWNDKKHSTQIFENGTYRLLENGEVKEEIQRDIRPKFEELLDLEKVKAEFGNDIKLKENGDLLEMTITKKEQTMTGVFSKSEGKLLKARVECVLDGTRTTLIDIDGIEYGI